MTQFTQEDVKAIATAVEAEIARQLAPIVESIEVHLETSAAQQVAMIDEAIQEIQQWVVGNKLGASDFMEAVLTAAITQARASKAVINDGEATQ